MVLLMGDYYPSSSTVKLLTKDKLYVVMNSETREVSTGTHCRGVPKLYRKGTAKSTATHLTNKTGVKWFAQEVTMYPVYGDD